MVFVYSKTIMNKLDEAHGLIITYPEFKVIDCGDFKTDDKIGIWYKIEADAYIDYIIGICDVLDMKYDFECEDGELFDIKIYLTKWSDENDNIWRIIKRKHSWYSRI